LLTWSLQVKHYENQLEEEYDEKKKLMSEKKELERQIQELGALTNNRDRGMVYLLVNKISCFINLWQVL
jgi:ABC-type enterochelin transport system substrate-binding protein